MIFITTDFSSETLAARKLETHLSPKGQYPLVTLNAMFSRRNLKNTR